MGGVCSAALSGIRAPFSTTDSSSNANEAQPSLFPSVEASDRRSLSPSSLNDQLPPRALPRERMFCASVSRVLCSLPPYFFMKCLFLSCSSTLALLQKDRNTRNHPVLLPFPQPNRTNWRGRGSVILLYSASNG